MAQAPTPEPSIPTPVFTSWTPEVATHFANVMASKNFHSLTEKCKKAESQADFDEVAREFTQTTIEVALETKACKLPSKRTTVSKPAPYQPWFDESCHVEKRKYFMLKKPLKRKGENC